MIKWAVARPNKKKEPGPFMECIALVIAKSSVYRTFLIVRKVFE